MNLLFRLMKIWNWYCQKLTSARVDTFLTALVASMQLPLRSVIGGCIPNLPDFPHSFPNSVPEQFLSNHLVNYSKLQYGL